MFYVLSLVEKTNLGTHKDMKSFFQSNKLIMLHEIGKIPQPYISYFTKVHVCLKRPSLSSTIVMKTNRITLHKYSVLNTFSLANYHLKQLEENLILQSNVREDYRAYQKWPFNLLAKWWRNWLTMPSSHGQTLHFENVINLSHCKGLDEKTT